MNTVDFAKKMRRLILDEIYYAQSGHPGGSLSVTDILAYLYNEEMNVSADKADDPDRDRLVLSKGHACPALYAALALKGYIPEKDLKTFRSIDSYLEGHPDMKKIKGVDMSSGSLGQGISAACGMALVGKKENRPYRVFAILGDGELEEGQVWEALMFAGHYGLDNLVVIVDHNDLQIDGKIDDVMNPKPFNKKFEDFGFDVIETDGENQYFIKRAFDWVREHKDGRPSVIISHSTKGSGISFMEGDPSWHGKAPNKEEYEKAIKEVE